MCHHGHCSPGVGITLLQFLKLVKGMKSSSTDDDCGTNEQCAGDLVIVENEGEGARCQDSSVSDSEHIEGTNAKHGAITSEQDDKTLSEHDNVVETEQAKVCNNLHKSFYILRFFTCRSEIEKFLY